MKTKIKLAIRAKIVTQTRIIPFFKKQEFHTIYTNTKLLL